MSESVNRIVKAALAPFGLPVAESLYQGKEAEYFTFNYADDHPQDFGDDDVLAYVAYLQVHYVCQWDKPYTDMKRRIRRALTGAGFTAPEVTDASDSAGRIRHLVFECSIENSYDLEE